MAGWPAAFTPTALTILKSARSSRLIQPLKIHGTRAYALHRCISTSSRNSFLGWFRRPSLCRVHGIEGTIQGVPAFASVATESQFNIISLDLAEECRLTLGPSE